MACTDCGFSTAAGAMNVPTDIVYAKLKSMVEGAKLASELLDDPWNVAVKRQKVANAPSTDAWS
jgi:hypothetical protein